jgi:hypothetical protein
MLLTIPIIAGSILLLNLVAFQQPAEDESISLRKAIIETLIILGVFLALSCEVLSVFKSLNTTGVVIAWSLFFFANLILAIVRHSFSSSWQRVWTILHQISRYEILLIALIMIVLILTFLTGILAPPNNYDSMLYHLPRVAHWIQDGNLAHFPSSYINQLAFPILAEEGILTFWLLSGSDALSFCVQFIAFMGSLIAVSYLAKRLGASRGGEWLAAFFALCLPGALLQASSTQNDLVTAFWFTCFMIYLVIQFKRSLGAFEFFCCSAALGLGLLTKGTFYLYIIVPVIWFVINLIQKIGLKRSISWISCLVLVVLVLNTGYWIRNVRTFGTPLGTSTLINSLVSHKDLVLVMFNPLRDFALNLVTPYETLNHRLFGWLFAPPGSTESPLPSYWMAFTWNDEDYAGNPIHLLLILGCLVVYLFSKKQHKQDFILYTIILLISFLMFSMGLQYNAYLIRLELPFFVAGAALFGYIAGHLINTRWLKYSLLALLFLFALPYCLINKYRPLIALRDEPEPFSLPSQWITGKTGGSIILEPKIVTFFAQLTQQHDPYIQMAERITTTDCHDIGLRLDSSDPEYPFWWLLSAPWSNYRLESMYVIPETERYIDPQFIPCAVICTICDEQPLRFGLKLAGHYGNAYLYLGE